MNRSDLREVLTKWVKRSDAWLAANPNKKSTPKEIVGSHGHRPHGPSILWPALYEHLRAKGMTKQKAAMISNGLWRKKRGLPPKSVPGTKGKVGTNILPDVRKVDMDDNYGRHGYTEFEKSEVRAEMRKNLRKMQPTAGDVHVPGPMPDFPKTTNKKKKKQPPFDESRP